MKNTQCPKCGAIEHQWHTCPAGEITHQVSCAEINRLRSETEDARKLLSFQEMHKSAELIKDKTRMDWLLKNSRIIVNGMYLTSRESLDAAITKAEPANSALRDSRQSTDG